MACQSARRRDARPPAHSVGRSNRARFHLPADGNPVLWALHQIDAFVAREIQQGLDNVAWLDGDSRSRLRLKKRAGLIERITALRPAII